MRGTRPRGEARRWAGDGRSELPSSFFETYSAFTNTDGGAVLPGVEALSGGVVLHYGDIAESERRWFGSVPATDPLRTLKDCAAQHLPPDLLRAAARDAIDRGFVTRDGIAVVENSPAPFGGLES